MFKSESASTENETISSLFDKGLKLQNDLCKTMDPSNSPQYQEKVKQAIGILEETTHLVNSMSMFSENESVEEVSTKQLKFFLLPVLLGDLNLKLTREQRLESLNLAEIYFNDFLQRCRDYHIIDDNSSKEADRLTANEELPPQHPGPLSFEEMARCREEKIRKFNEAKELESKIARLKLALDNPTTDESLEREYYLSLIKKFVSATGEELKAIVQEKPIVEHLALMKKGSQGSQKFPAHYHKPLKPIVITRDAAQKAVFGIGYPSIPAMTVEELVDQRLKEGWYGGKTQHMGANRSLMDETIKPEQEASNREQETVMQEIKVESDDAEVLFRARQFDDWKDDHRRGYGNRHNMG